MKRKPGIVPEFTQDYLDTFREDVDGLLEEWEERDPGLGEPRAMFDLGESVVALGMFGLARRCFESALPFLLRDATSAVADVPDRYIPEPQTEDDAASGHIVLGFDKHSRSEVWTQIALCRWFLEGRHDQKSFTNAAEQLYLHYTQDRVQDLWKPEAFEEVGFVYHAGGYDAQLASYFAEHPAFREPKKIATLKSEPLVAWVLAKQRLEKCWPEEQIAAMWESFLRHSLPKRTVEDVLPVFPMWVKLAWWDSAAEPKPSPFELSLRVYDYLPGAKPPKVEW